MTARNDIAEDRLEPAARPIPEDSSAKGPSHRNQGAVEVRRACANVHPPATVELARLKQTRYLGTKPGTGPGHGLGAKALPSLASASGDDATATGSAHSVAESVFVLALTVARLKRPFHRGFPFRVPAGDVAPRPAGNQAI